VTARPRGKGKARPRPDDGAWRDDWNTPELELDLVRDVAGHFDGGTRVPARILIDPCWNRSAITNPYLAYWSESVIDTARDGLGVSWSGALVSMPPAVTARPGLIFVNPPYSALDVWLAKCAREAPRVRELGHYIAALVPARVEQTCWTDVVRTTSFVAFREGRITFLHPEGERASSAPMPIALLVWSPFDDLNERRSFQGKGWWCAEVLP
jgi:hypothetical protein